MLINEELKTYGIKSASMISEGIFKPRIIIKHLDNSVYSYYVNEEIISIELLNDIINKHINTVCIKKSELIN